MLARRISAMTRKMIKNIGESVTPNAMSVRLADALKMCEGIFPNEVVVIFVLEDTDKDDNYNVQKLHISSNTSEDDTFALVRSLAISAVHEEEQLRRPN